MEHILYAKQKIDELSKEINSSHFDDNDLRKSYLDHMFGILSINYLKWCAIYSADAIKAPVVAEKDKLIVDSFLKIVKNEGYFHNIKNSLNRSLFLDSWSTFEFFLTYICDKVFDESTKSKMLEHDFVKLVKILSRHELSDEELLKLRSYSIKKHLTHLPVTRKYEKLYSVYKSSYQGDWDEDCEFLAFFGKYRNSMHTNYIYHGQNKNYTILGVTYYFINNEAIRLDREIHIADMINLAVKLKDTAVRLFNAIQYPGLLEYPAEQISEVQL